jgi:hypothetical protein
MKSRSHAGDELQLRMTRSTSRKGAKGSAMRRRWMIAAATLLLGQLLDLFPFHLDWDVAERVVVFVWWWWLLVCVR